MNERYEQLMAQAWIEFAPDAKAVTKRFAELIVKEMCGMMEQTEDDAYHCFEPSERPTEYIEWLNQWRTRFEKHFGVE